MVPVEAGRNLLIQGRIRQQVACQLLDREPIERHVAIEGIDDPIAPPPHVALAVSLIAVAVGVSRGLEPRERHPLAVARRLQESIDDVAIGIHRSICHEPIDLGRRGRQADEIERDAANPRRAVRVRSGPQTLSLEPFEHEGVDWIPDPVLIGHDRKRGASGRHERPVLLPCRSLFDPSLDDRHIPAAERLTALRHPPGGGGQTDTAEHLAVARVSRNDSQAVVGQRVLGDLFSIEPQAGHLLRRPVTDVAIVRQDRPDVAVELNGLGNGAGIGPGRECLRSCHEGDREQSKRDRQPATPLNRVLSSSSHRSPPRSAVDHGDYALPRACLPNHWRFCRRSRPTGGSSRVIPSWSHEGSAQPPRDRSPKGVRIALTVRGR